jgi:putative membrane protein
MVTNPFRSSFRLVRELWLHLLPIVAYVFVISWLDLQYHLEDMNFPVPIVAVLGTVIGLLLAFRTNSSYGRWWAARILWGAIVNDSRTWTRQLLEFASDDLVHPVTDPVIRRMAYRQIAWCHALSRSLRGQRPTMDFDGFIDEPELESYRSSHNTPNDLLLRQAMELRKLFDTNRLEMYQFVELEKTLTRLTDSMGGCERIKNTPFPRTYGLMVHASIYVFVAFLPLGLVNVPAAGLISTSLSLAFAFMLIEHVSVYLQDPFSNRPSDTPMLSLSRTIEINIKQMLGETRLPEKLAPVDGVLH